MSVNAKIRVLPHCQNMSEKAQLFKESIAELVICCQEINKVCTSSATNQRYLPGDISRALSGLFLLASQDVYYELFGEFPRRQS